MTVYGDLYFLLNGGVDFVLLLAAGRVGRARTGGWRLAGAAAAGAAYATAQLWFPGAWAFGLVGRVLASLAMVALAYAPVPWRRFLVLCAYLYAGAIFVAGATLAVSLAAAAGWGGGLPRWLGGRAGGAIPWWALAIGLAGALWAARAWRNVRSARQPWLVGVRVVVGDGSVCCRGLVDSGNRLVDPLGSGVVVVVEARVLASLAPPGLAVALGDVAAAARAAEGTDWERRLRLIPFRALGTDGGLLLGFRPDAVVIDGDGDRGSAAGRRPSDPPPGGAVTIGVTPRRLDPSGDYQALVPLCLVAEAGSQDEPGAGGVPHPPRLRPRPAVDRRLAGGAGVRRLDGASSPIRTGSVTAGDRARGEVAGGRPDPHVAQPDDSRMAEAEGRRETLRGDGPELGEGIG